MNASVIAFWYELQDCEVQHLFAYFVCNKSLLPVGEYMGLGCAPELYDCGRVKH